MKSAVAAITAALIFSNCSPPQPVPDAGIQQDAGTQTLDAGQPDAGTMPNDSVLHDPLLR